MTILCAKVSKPRRPSPCAVSSVGDMGEKRVVPIRAETAICSSKTGAVDRGWLANCLGAHDAQCTVKDGILSQDERFGLHSLKHRGVTDTKGNKKASGRH